MEAIEIEVEYNDQKKMEVEIKQSSGGGIEEAPLDGALYGRKKAQWQEITKDELGALGRDDFISNEELENMFG